MCRVCRVFFYIFKKSKYALVTLMSLPRIYALNMLKIPGTPDTPRLNPLSRMALRCAGVGIDAGTGAAQGRHIGGTDLRKGRISPLHIVRRKHAAQASAHGLGQQSLVSRLFGYESQSLQGLGLMHL